MSTVQHSNQQALVLCSHLTYTQYATQLLCTPYRIQTFIYLQYTHPCRQNTHAEVHARAHTPHIYSLQCCCVLYIPPPPPLVTAHCQQPRIRSV